MKQKHSAERFIIDLFFIKNFMVVNIRSFFQRRKGANIGYLYVFILEKTNKQAVKRITERFHPKTSREYSDGLFSSLAKQPAFA